MLTLAIAALLNVVGSHISCQNYFCQIAKVCEDVLNHEQVIATGRFFSTVVLTLSFDLDL